MIIKDGFFLYEYTKFAFLKYIEFFNKSIHLQEFDETIGLDKLMVIHLNDSKNIKGAPKDLHENLGYGTIGFDNLANIAYNKKLTKILRYQKIHDITTNHIINKKLKC